MSIWEIQQYVSAIERIKDDYERAHSLEDELYWRVLQAIADGAENAKELAEAALKARDIKFARLFA